MLREVETGRRRENVIPNVGKNLDDYPVVVAGIQGQKALQQLFQISVVEHLFLRINFFSIDSLAGISTSSDGSGGGQLTTPRRLEEITRLLFLILWELEEVVSVVDKLGAEETSVPVSSL
ncbi:hypothetical protein MIMGU_mgv1a016484mg [Erythranthe guttata]|uniref:Uncharacterized protein n=1 Tax=Erythranthe guttata TaxID=4155 RepID=A0A022RJH2_ERYGU|nr:hypothetical protein MIMGU_mgv1a016484mg [Erythranthe guttata]